MCAALLLPARQDLNIATEGLGAKMSRTMHARWRHASTSREVLPAAVLLQSLPPTAPSKPPLTYTAPGLQTTKLPA